MVAAFEQLPSAGTRGLSFEVPGVEPQTSNSANDEALIARSVSRAWAVGRYKLNWGRAVDVRANADSCKNIKRETPWQDLLRVWPWKNDRLMISRRDSSREKENGPLEFGITTPFQ